MNPTVLKALITRAGGEVIRLEIRLIRFRLRRIRRSADGDAISSPLTVRETRKGRGGAISGRTPASLRIANPRSAMIVAKRVSRVP